jgi:hypothetical protein
LSEKEIIIIGGLLDIVLSLTIWVSIGYLISLIFKSKRKIIITVSVVLALLGSIYNEVSQPTQSQPEQNAHKNANQKVRFNETELQNLFNKAINDSNGGILNISYVQQGDTIEVDVSMPETGWDLLDSTDKKSMVNQLGKGLQLAIKESTLYSPSKDVYVSFRGDPNNDELAYYDNEQVIIER